MAFALDQIRSQFPHTQSQIYLNHAAISPLSSAVLAACQDYLIGRHSTLIENYPVLIEELENLRHKLGTLVGAPSSAIALTQNTSSGLNIMAQDLDWQAGDRILLNRLEFPANVYPFVNLQSRGVIIDWVEPEDYYLSLEAIAAKITPRTRLLSISYVQFLSGQRMDLVALGALCQQHEILFCVDAIQGLGASPLDLAAAKIDFLACGGHKWLMALQGLGFVAISERLQAQLKPSQIGWLSVLDSWELLDYQLNLRPDAARYELGTPNGIGIRALLTALTVFEKASWPEIEAHILSLSGFLIPALQAAGLTVITPAAESERLGIVTCLHPQADAIQKQLEAAQIFCSAREGKYLRFSPHWYNTQTELEQMLEVLEPLL